MAAEVEVRGGGEGDKKWGKRLRSAWDQTEKLFFPSWKTNICFPIQTLTQRNRKHPPNILRVTVRSADLLLQQAPLCSIKLSLVCRLCPCTNNNGLFVFQACSWDCSRSVSHTSYFTHLQHQSLERWVTWHKVLQDTRDPKMHTNTHTHIPTNPD